MSNRIRKAKIEVTMMWDGELHPEFDPGKYTLSDLHEEMYSGFAIGSHWVVQNDWLPEDRVEQELLDVGNDGTFFDPVD